MSFNVKGSSIVNQLLKDINSVTNSSSVESRTNSILQGNSESFVTAENISAGDPVILNGDGTVSSAFNKLPISTGITITPESIVHNTRLNRIILVGKNSLQSATVDSNLGTLTLATQQTYASGSMSSYVRAFYISDRIYIFYRVSNTLSMISGIFSGATELITFGTPVVVTTGSNMYNEDITYSSSLNRFIVGYILSASDTILRLRVIEPVPIPNSVTVNSEIIIIGSDRYYDIALCYNETEEILAVFCTDRNVLICVSVVIQITSDTTATYTEFQPITTPVVDKRFSSALWMDCCYDIISNRVIVVISDWNSWDLGLAMVCKVSRSKDRFLFGTAFPFAYNIVEQRCFALQGRIYVTYKDLKQLSGNDPTKDMNIAVLSVNNTFNTLSLDCSFQTIVLGNATAAMVYDSTSDRIIYAGNIKYRIFPYPSSFSDPFRPPFQFIGFANESRNAGEIITVSVFGICDKLSGLTPGVLYYVGETALTTTSSVITAGKAVSSTIIKIAPPAILYK